MVRARCLALQSEIGLVEFSVSINISESLELSVYVTFENRGKLNARVFIIKRRNSILTRLGALVEISSRREDRTTHTIGKSAFRHEADEFRLHFNKRYLYWILYVLKVFLMMLSWPVLNVFRTNNKTHLPAALISSDFSHRFRNTIYFVGIRYSKTRGDNYNYKNKYKLGKLKITRIQSTA